MIPAAGEVAAPAVGGGRSEFPRRGTVLFYVSTLTGRPARNAAMSSAAST